MEHKCQQCGTEFDGNFCPNCGTGYDNKKVCPYCGAKLQLDAKFCNNCGKNMQAQTTVAQTGNSNFPTMVKFARIFPWAAIALFSALTWLFCLCPIFTISFLGEEESVSIYATIGDETLSELNGVALGIVIVAAISTLYALIGFAKQKQVGQSVGFGILSLLVYLAQLIPAAVASSKIKEAGFLVGSGLTLLIVFSSIFIFFAIVALISRRFFGSSDAIKQGFVETQEVVSTEKNGNIDVAIGGLKYTLNLRDDIATISRLESSSGEIVIPQTVVHFGRTFTVTKIGREVFRGCLTLTSITIPDSVTSIGSHAFAGWSSLTSIAFAENSQLTSIGEDAFEYCSKLTSITIPDSVSSIGNFAFWDCISLTSVAFAENSQLTSIGSSAFSHCTSLTSITIPDSVTTIGSYAFSHCTSLTSITIPDSVTSIGSHAFYGCTGLTIYCEAASKPAGWDSYWNPDSRPVVWGYKG